MVSLPCSPRRFQTSRAFRGHEHLLHLGPAGSPDFAGIPEGLVGLALGAKEVISFRPGQFYQLLDINFIGSKLACQPGAQLIGLPRCPSSGKLNLGSWNDCMALSGKVLCVKELLCPTARQVATLCPSL
jgi:hypothetical protein